MNKTIFTKSLGLLIFALGFIGQTQAQSDIFQDNSEPISAGSFMAVDLLPDIYVAPNYLYDNDISTTTIPGRRVLRLSNGTANIGLGKLYIYGTLPSNGDGTQNINQRIYRTDGTFYDRPAGRFIFHAGHDHIHVENWSIFRLRQILPGDGVGAVVAQGAKTSFCILDLQVYNSSLPNYNPRGQFLSCASTIQGLSVGWVDIYGKHLAGQNIDVTTLADGVYWLESEVDPGNTFLESNETNNISRVKVTIGTPAPINADAYEPNNSLAIVNDRVEGSINSPNLGPCAPIKNISGLTIQGSSDPDFFKFYLNSTGGPSDYVKTTFTHALGDVDMVLLSSANVQLAKSEGIVNNETISLNGRAKGWYFLRVYGYNGATNPSYGVIVDPPANGSPSITTTAPPVGNVNVLHAIDNYSVNWTFSDPEADKCWVTVYVNSAPVLNGSQVLLPTSINTDASAGLFNINTSELPLGTYYVYCQISDAGTVTGSWAPGTITLVENNISGTIAGTVTGAGGLPLADLTVTLINTGSTARTNNSGQYAFNGLLSSSYGLSFSYAGYFDTTVLGLILSAPNTTFLDMQMRPIPPPVGTISGIVRNQSAVALPGVTVQLLSPLLNSTTDILGQFSFSNLLSGVYSLKFSSVGYLDTTVVGTVVNAPATTNIAVIMRAVPTPVGTISGIVRNQSAVALPGVTVQLLSPLQNSTTDILGQFSFSNLLSGVYSLKFSSVGYLDTTVVGTVVNAPATTNIAVIMRAVPTPVGTISGIVRNQSAVALPGVTVQLLSPLQNSTTDILGQFSFSNLLSGVYSLKFSSVGYLDTTVVGTVVNAPATTNIAVIMRAVPTEPVADAYEPNNSLPELVAKPLGAYNSANLGPCGPLKVITNLSIHSTSADYYMFTTNSVGGPSDFVRIAFTHSQGDLDMTLLAVNNSILGKSDGTTNTETISLNGRAKGMYVLRIYGYNGAKSPNYTLTIDPPGNQTPSITTLTPLAGNLNILRGVGNFRVYWSHSDPETDKCWVSVFVNSSPTLDGNQILLTASQNTDASLGSYLINSTDLALGTYWVYTQVTDAGTTAGSWSAGTVSFVSDVPTATLTGTVTGLSSLALVNASVSLVNPPQSALTDSAGRFSFTNLPSGNYSVKVTAQNYYDTTVVGVSLSAPSPSDISINMTAQPQQCDDFADGDISNWLNVSGAWSATGGILKGNSDLLDAVLLSSFGNYSSGDITSKIRIFTNFTDKKARIVFGYIDANNYRFIEGDDYNDRWRIVERVGGVNTIQLSVLSPINSTAWHSIRVTLLPNGLATLVVGSSTIGSYKFASAVSGRVGCGYSRSNCDFDDFCMTGPNSGSATTAGTLALISDDLVPAEYSLSQNYPNPFNPSTQISFTLPSAAPVTLRVYNILGEMVIELVDEQMTAGPHTVEWNGANRHGQRVASGVYIYLLQSGSYHDSKKMLLLK